jgi:hypothetical protein
VKFKTRGSTQKEVKRRSLTMIHGHYCAKTLEMYDGFARFDQQLQAMDSRESNSTGLNCFEFVLTV